MQWPTTVQNSNRMAMMFYGPLVDRIGSQAGLHPYRRANVMDCNVLGLGSVVPVVSSFLLIASLLTDGPDSVSALALFAVTFYPLLLSIVMAFSILTGWGRRFEGPEGRAVREAVDITDINARVGTHNSAPAAQRVGAEH